MISYDHEYCVQFCTLKRLELLSFLVPALKVQQLIYVLHTVQLRSCYDIRCTKYKTPVLRGDSGAILPNVAIYKEGTQSVFWIPHYTQALFPWLLWALAQKLG